MNVHAAAYAGCLHHIARASRHLRMRLTEALITVAAEVDLKHLLAVSLS
jgi:predicted thioesterase